MDNFSLYPQVEENFDLMDFYEFVSEEQRKEDQIKSVINRRKD